MNLTIEQAHQLLGVNEHSSRSRIKQAVWMGDYRSYGQKQRERREAARDLLLKNYVLDSSNKAKAARRQEKLDDQVRRTFSNSYHRAHWMQQEVPAYKPKLDKFNKLWADYMKLPHSERLRFIEKHRDAFKLTPTEEKMVPST